VPCEPWSLVILITKKYGLLFFMLEILCFDLKQLPNENTGFNPARTIS
jgi:hypothetical protein